MTRIYDVNAQELVAAVAAELKKNNTITPPEWAPLVKTGHMRERPPLDKDWWYFRAASVLRTVKRLGPIGVSKLRTRYGGKKNCGVAAERFCKASGSILRKILQQLEKAELIKQGKKGVHKGRIVAPKGDALLDRTAITLAKAKPKVAEVESEKVEKKEAPAKPKAEPKKEPAEEKKQAPPKHPVEKAAPKAEAPADTTAAKNE